jgi:beta-galactosidase
LADVSSPAIGSALRSAHEDSRWYSGQGIYRPVYLHVGRLVHLGIETLRVTTPEIDGGSVVVEVEETVENESAVTRTLSVETQLLDAEEVDRSEATFGIRTLQLDPKHGLRVNGRIVKLRGACVHHDNGPIGAATIGARGGVAGRAASRPPGSTRCAARTTR